MRLKLTFMSWLLHHANREVREKAEAERQRLLKWLRANNARVTKAFASGSWPDVAILAFPEHVMPAYGTKWVAQQTGQVITVAYAPRLGKYVWVNGHNITVIITDAMNINPMP